MLYHLNNKLRTQKDAVGPAKRAMILNMNHFMKEHSRKCTTTKVTIFLECNESSLGISFKKDENQMKVTRVDGKRGLVWLLISLSEQRGVLCIRGVEKLAYLSRTRCLAPCLDTLKKVINKRD